MGSDSTVEWKRNLVAHGDAREEKWRGKRRMEWVAKQSSVWLGTVHPVLLQAFSPDPHSKKASTRLNWHPRRYKWTRPFRWKTESGFCACAITFRFHSTCIYEAENCDSETTITQRNLTYNETSYTREPTFPVRTPKTVQYDLQLIVFNDIDLKLTDMIINTRDWYLKIKL